MKVLFLATLALASNLAHGAERTGAELFSTHCASCHGDDAEGGGPVAAIMRNTAATLGFISISGFAARY